MKKGDIIRKIDSHWLGVVKCRTIIGDNRPAVFVLWLKTRRHPITLERPAVYRRNRSEFFGDALYEEGVEVLEETNG